MDSKKALTEAMQCARIGTGHPTIPAGPGWCALCFRDHCDDPVYLGGCNIGFKLFENVPSNTRMIFLHRRST